MTGDGVVLDLRARELPLLERVAYLDHATIGPLPRSHARAVADTVERIAAEGQRPGEGSALLDAARTAAAELLHADAERIGLLKSTSEGLGLVARGLDWRAGDEVVLYERDFVGCLAPFVELERDGVVVRWAPDSGERLALEDVEPLIGPRTRAVCVSLVDRAHGQRLPVAELGALCRAHGAWLVVDAAQAMGVLDLDPAALGADVVAAHSYKFLCAGFGLAVTWCSPRACAELRVPQVGWRNAELDEARALHVAEGTAARFESSQPSLPALAGLGASLGVLAEIDPATREARALDLAARAAAGLAGRGWAPLAPRAAEERSSIVVARHPHHDAGAVAEALRAQGIACGVVGDALRVAAHGVNVESDVDRLLDALPAA